MLSVNGVTKMYDYQNGIEEISFSCKSGDVVSIIGPNGSGKSTLLKIMAGVLPADQGSVYIGEHDTAEFESRRKIGYMPDDFELMQDLTGKAFLYMISDYKYGGRFKEDIDKAVKDFELAQYIDKKFGKLSMGNKKKLSMIAAFIGKPELIILDEPTNGVDASGIITLKQYIETAQKNGSIVIVSSHILDFVSKIATNNIFLKKGKIITVENSKQQLEDIYKSLYL